MHCLLLLIAVVITQSALSALIHAQDNVFMFWTTPWQDRFLPRHEAVLSSYTTHGYNVTVFTVVNGCDGRLDGVQKRFGGVHFVSIDDAFIGALGDCPNSQWLVDVKVKRGPYYYSHLTDYLRFCLLFKEGGIYSDFDALLLRRLPTAPPGKLLLGKDEIGDDERSCTWCLGGGRHYGAPGVMVAGGPGVRVLDKAMQIGFGADYEADRFGWCGPQAITRAIKQSRRNEVVLLPTHSLYPVNWSNAGKLFRASHGTLWTRMVNNPDTYSIHFYGSATKNLQIEPGSIMDKFVGKPVLVLKHYWDHDKEHLTDSIMIFEGNRVTFECEQGLLNVDSISHIGSIYGLNQELKNVKYTPNDNVGGHDDILTISVWQNDQILDRVRIALINLEHHVTVVTKTFGRMSKALSLVESIHDVYPKHKLTILVGDDGKSAQEDEQKYRSPLFRYVPFEYDIGLSEGRNRLLRMVTTNYALFLDDDFVLTRESDIGALLAASILDKADIVGGKSPSDVSEFQFDYCGLMRLHEHNQTLSLIHSFHDNGEPKSITGCKFVDFVPNLFIAKTASLRRVLWDSKLKLGEHEDFFWRAKLVGLTVATLPAVSFKHMQSKFWENKTEYDRMRLRVFDFLQVALQKHNWTALVTMGRTVMQLMDISELPIAKLSVESKSPFEMGLTIIADKPYKRYRLEYYREPSGKKNTKEVYDTNSFTIPDLEEDKEYTLSVFAGNYTAWSRTAATIRIKTPSLHDNLLIDGGFDSKWPSWQGSIGTAFNFEPTVPWKEAGLLAGRSTGFALGVSVIHSEPLERYTKQHQFYHSVHQTVRFDNIKNRCEKGGKLVLAGWSRPDRFTNTDIPNSILGYRLQLQVRLTDHRLLSAVSADFDHQKNEWQSRVATLTLSEHDVIQEVTVRAILDAMRAGAFFDDFYLGLWCK